MWMLSLLGFPLIGWLVPLGYCSIQALRRRKGTDLLQVRRRYVMGAGVFASAAAIAWLRSHSENGAMPSLALVILLALVSTRIGRTIAARASARLGPSSVRSITPAAQLPVDAQPRPGRSSFSIAASSRLLLPLVLLLPLGLIDMGLLLVMALPIGIAAVLAVGLQRLVLLDKLMLSIAVVVSALLVRAVLFPDVAGIRATSMLQRAARFEEMQGVFGVKPGLLATSLERAAARAVATRDQDAAERLLLAARPGVARDLIVPSIEQVWGGRAYAASGLLGVGLGGAIVGGRGIAIPVSYAENTFAVYVMHEHGALGGSFVLLAYLLFGFAALLAARNAVSTTTESLRSSRALYLVAALMVVVPATYVALSNLGVVPITGQNMPFLGLNAWSDVTLCAGIIGILITGGIRVEGAQSHA